MLPLLLSLLLVETNPLDEIARQFYALSGQSAEQSQLQASSIKLHSIEVAGKRVEEIPGKVYLRPTGLRFLPAEKVYAWHGSVILAGTNRSLPLAVRFETPPLQEQAVLLRDMRAGAILNESVLQGKRVYWTPLLRARKPIAPREAIAKRASRALRAGAFLYRSDVVSDSLVHRGDHLTAVQQMGRATLRFPVVALDSGELGGQVRVRKPGSAQILSAVVLANGEVQIHRGGSS